MYVHICDVVIKCNVSQNTFLSALKGCLVSVNITRNLPNTEEKVKSEN